MSVWLLHAGCGEGRQCCDANRDAVPCPRCEAQGELGEMTNPSEPALTIGQGPGVAHLNSHPSNGIVDPNL